MYKKGGQTPLRAAASYGHHQIFELLLEKGKAKVDLADRVLVFVFFILF